MVLLTLNLSVPCWFAPVLRITELGNSLAPLSNRVSIKLEQQEEVPSIQNTAQQRLNHLRKGSGRKICFYETAPLAVDLKLVS